MRDDVHGHVCSRVHANDVLLLGHVDGHGYGCSWVHANVLSLPHVLAFCCPFNEFSECCAYAYHGAMCPHVCDAWKKHRC